MRPSCLGRYSSHGFETWFLGWHDLQTRFDPAPTRSKTCFFAENARPIDANIHH